ncbi:unnamed protein product [Macrosiphum euphorbiae]|uniref:Uncharacterized protein n=1 Tax=Macrosiphum euphorbiae TaxID=13131 RepID=A0AAV0Y839_9HEMI|nr:unnamed protein product [Macrosiphum euphorbiae]
MDLLSPWSMLDSVKLEIGQIHFDSILESSIHFSNNMNDLLNSMNLPEDLLISSSLPVTRNIRKKRMYDDLCEDETPELPLDKFRVETYQTIIDQIIYSLNFIGNNQLIVNVHYLISKKCKQTEQMQNTALKHLANLLNLDNEQLCLELKNFSKVYPKLKMSTIEKTKQIYRQFDTDSDTDNDENNICSDTTFSCE